MRNFLLAATAIALATPAWAQDARPLTDEERAQALQELQDLRARMTALENRLGVSPPPPVQYTPAAPRPPKDHNLELYGFVQLDAIQDFKRVNPNWDATLRPSRIPTEEGQFGGDGQSIFSVRQSRLGAKATGNLWGKPYEAKFEFDLYGTGVDAGQTTFRVRHMYGSWGPILVGQTNTLWMDADIFPNVVDYWGPPGMVFVRNPQIRFTFLDRDGWKAAVALNPATSILDEGARFPDCRPEPLTKLFVQAGLENVEVRAIDVPTVFKDFNDYWTPFLGGQGPAPGYCMSLSDHERAALGERISKTLPTQPDRSIRLIARAWAVRGNK